MSCPIQRASELSGLTAHVIRIWERRYNALSPSRTCTNRRMYCDEAITRLKLLRILTENGHRIGGVARLCTAELEALVKKVSCAAFGVTDCTCANAEEFVSVAMAASKKYDSHALRCVLQQARMQLGQCEMLHTVICPLVMKIGDEWRQGNLRPSHEHIATAVIRELLLTATPTNSIPRDAPELIVATPAGEVHELGALIATAAARELGWHVTYLGTNLPVEEIACCAVARQAQAVALSVVFPEKCPTVEAKLRRMRELLPRNVGLIVGGRAAEGYRAGVSDLDILWANCIDGFDEALRKIRK